MNSISIFAEPGDWCTFELNHSLSTASLQDAGTFLVYFGVDQPRLLKKYGLYEK